LARQFPPSLLERARGIIKEIRRMLETWVVGLHWAVAHVLDDAQDYPCFIQLWGQALWEVLSGTRTYSPGMEVANEARKKVDVQRLELYSRRMEELVNSGLLIPFAEMAWRLGKDGQPAGYDLGLALNHIEPGSSLLGDHPEARLRLLHTGFVWEPSAGVWEYGIPSLASHLRGNSVDLLLEQLQNEGTLAALKALCQCFDTMLKQPLVRKRDDLERVLGQYNEGYDPLERFQEMKLLMPTPQPGYLRLMAPHLVEGILAEAERLQLIAAPEPDGKPDPSPDWPPRPSPF